jgi:hypothetical protein
VSWEHFIVPLSKFTDDLDWVSEVTGQALARPPSQLPLPSVRQVLDALAGAGCHGLLYFELAADADDDLRKLLEEFAEPGPILDGNYFGALTLDGPSLDSHAVTGDMLVDQIAFGSAHGDTVQAAALALRGFFGDVFLFDAGYNGSFFLMMAEDELPQIAAEWPW